MMKLTYIALHLTYVCENRCPYCYIGDGERNSHPSFSKVARIVKRLAANGVKEILLVGGNPCIYPDLKKVVGLIKKLNLKTFILSNTLAFGEDFKFFLNNVDSLQATVLGATSEGHDAEAGRRGAYQELVRNIRALNGQGKKISIAISLHKNNCGKVFEIAKNLVVNEKLKIKELVVQRTIPLGRADKTLKFSITKDQVPGIFQQLQAVKDDYGLKIDFEDPFPLCLAPRQYRYLQNKPCQWGYIKASVNFNGDLSRCGADARFLLGNIFKANDLQKFWKENPTLSHFRSGKWLPKKCQRCDLLKRCGGGCSLSKITNKDHECDILCPAS